MEKIIAVTVVFILIIVGTFVIFNKNSNLHPTSSPLPNPEDLQKYSIEDFIFTKEEEWGPCPPSNSCTQKTILRGNGTLFKEGADNAYVFVNTFDLLTITNKLEKTKIMEKDCLAEPVTDYSAKTTIKHKGQIKEINFPGCQQELEQIEKLFPKTQTN